MVYLSLAFDDHIVNVYLHIAADLSFKDAVHHPLVCGPSIDQAEGHDLESVYGLVSDEGSLRDILLRHADLIIARECIYET